MRKGKSKQQRKLTHELNNSTPELQQRLRRMYTAWVKTRLLRNIPPHGKANMINNMAAIQDELIRRGAVPCITFGTTYEP